MNVSAETASVKTSKTEFAGSSPRTTVLPVIKPMVRTAGMVSPIDASTEPNRMLIERCRQDQRLDQEPSQRCRRMEDFDSVVDRECNFLCQHDDGKQVHHQQDPV